MPRPRKVPNEVVLGTIIQLIDDGTEFNSSEVGAKIGLSRPTVNRRLKEMDDADWLRVKPYRDDSGHRRYTVRVLAKGRKALERYEKAQAA